MVAVVSEQNLTFANNDSDRKNVLYLWETLDSTTNTSGRGIRTIGNLSDIIVQAIGTFNATTVTIQGSLDNTNWVTVKDPADAAVTFTAAGGSAIRDKWRYIRPLLSGGTSDDVDVYLQLTGAN